MKIDTLKRRIALFFAIMASGGNIIINSEVWVVVTFIATLIALNGRLSPSGRFFPIYAWIGAVIAILLAKYGIAGGLSTLSRLLVFVTAALLLSLYQDKDTRPHLLEDDLFAILKPMTVQAIITSILGNLAPSLFTPLDVNGLAYYHIAFVFNFHYIDNVTTTFIRPNGLFYEPGVYQIYLSIFLFLALYVRKSFRWSSIGLIAVITTVSSIGLLIATLLLAAFPFAQGGRLQGRSLLAGFFIVLVGFPVVLFVFTGNIEQKVFGNNRGSFIARQYDLLTGLNIVEAFPLSGIGFSSESYRQQKVYLGAKDSFLPEDHALSRQNTNGVMQIFFTIGVPLGILLFFGILRQKLFDQRILFPAIIILSLMGQALVFSVFFLFICFSGMTYRFRRAGEVRSAAA